MTRLHASLLLVAMPWLAQTLHCTPHLSYSHVTRSIACHTRITSQCVLVAERDDAAPDGTVQPDNGYPGRAMVRSVFEVIFEVQRVFFDVLAGLLAVGLVLNVCGIGYDITPDGGFVVKPISEFRRDAADARFSRAAAQSVGEPTIFMDPPSNP